MSDPAPEERKARLRARFDAVALTYDRLRFLRIPAERLVAAIPLAPGDRVLDVATGTGTAALLAAEQVGGEGQVVGIDLAPRMLAVAREKGAAAGYRQLEFRPGDAEHLQAADASFDAVLCASSLFFLPDMAGALREWRRVLVPRGVVGFTSFGPSFLQPLRALWKARLEQHGLTLGTLPSHRVEDVPTAVELLTEAGFVETQVRMEQSGYYLPSPVERWMDIEAGVEGLPLDRLSPPERRRVRAEHLSELAEHVDPQGLWVALPVLVAWGRHAD